jgi:mevalonate kinase
MPKFDQRKFWEIVVVAFLGALAGNATSFFLDSKLSMIERAFGFLVTGLLICGVAFVYVRNSGASGSRLFPKGQEHNYEDELTAITKRHVGYILWSTKTSIWADSESALKSRQRIKRELLGKQIKGIRYLIHFGVWRRSLQELSGASNFVLINEYLYKLKTLRDNISDHTKCPPGLVEFLAGETSAERAPPIFGVYVHQNSRKSALALPDVELMSSEAAGQMIMSADAVDVGAFQRRFEQMWHGYEAEFRDEMREANLNYADPNSKRDFMISKIDKEIAALRSLRDHDPRRTDDIFDGATILARLNQGREVLLRCAQKVTLSGDYNDMRGSGKSLTAAVATNSLVSVRRNTVGRTQVFLNGDLYPSAETKGQWPLVDAICDYIRNGDVHLDVHIHTGDTIEMGLGSSSAASVMFAAVEQLLEGKRIDLLSLAKRAHEFETVAGRMPCGPQDHVAATLGSLRAIEYPSLASTRIVAPEVWNNITFWRNRRARRARDVIPNTVGRHNELDWREKEFVTSATIESFVNADVPSVVKSLTRECEVQKRVGMLTEEQIRASSIAASFGAAMKVSGAGGGGVMVCAIENRARLSELRQALQRGG